jgi:putative two-component system response regulator
MFKNWSEKKFLESNETIFKLAYISEINEWDNRNHLERISKYAYVIASSLGLSTEEATIISIACQLHDVGKILTPVEILRTTGNIQPGDWEIIEKHTFLGAKILESKSSFLLQTGSVIAMTHHERWDGSGYPQHLKGQEIPLSGSICALLDVYDALTTARIYRQIIAEEEALRIINENSGILFDPKIVKAFEKEFLEIRKIKNACEKN